MLKNQMTGIKIEKELSSLRLEGQRIIEKENKECLIKLVEIGIPEIREKIDLTEKMKVQETNKIHIEEPKKQEV